MNIRCLTLGMFNVNVFVIEDPDTGDSALIDTSESGQELLAALDSLQPQPRLTKVLLTHGHIDHAGALVDLQARYPELPTYLPRLELPLFKALPEQGDWFSMPQLNRPCGRIDHYLDDGDTVSLGTLTLSFLSTPGHTPGQGCYYDQDDIIVGDTLFAGSVGRTDFPGSDPALAKKSLTRLLALPGHLRVHSGHGPVTTLAHELSTNPFLDFLRS